MSKTPQFDQKINAILSNLKPHSRVCRICEEKFEIVAEDIEFYKKMRVPAPTLCPDCRHLRRALYRNARTLFTKTSIKGEKILSLYREDSPFKILPLAEWDAMRENFVDYGIAYKKDQSFFDQFRALQLSVPKPALSGTSSSTINAVYGNNIKECKNCYMVFLGGMSENSGYLTAFLKIRESYDLFRCNSCELCYECAYANNCYNVNYAYYSDGCRDCSFIYDCDDCQNCFGCTNLRHKQYYWFNEKLTVEAYHERLRGVQLNRFDELQKMIIRFKEFCSKASYANIDIDESSVDCEGNHFLNSQRCRASYDISDAINVAHSREITMTTKDSMDVDYVAGPTELTYEKIGGSTNVYKQYFTLLSGLSRDSEYCDACTSCTNCFGCVGLARKYYCILNQQYSESDYWDLVDHIKCKMLEDREYGEFLPMAYANHPYLDSCATEDSKMSAITFQRYIERENCYFNVSRESFGYGEAVNGPQVKVCEFIGGEDEWPDDKILSTVFACSETGKPFKIQKQELAFYRKMKLPLPRLHPETRHQKRFYWRGARKLRDSTCAECGTAIKTVYPEDFIGKVCCRQCYQKAIN